MEPSDTAADRCERIKELFASAMSVGPAARVAVLDEACGGDAELRNAVQALLDDHDSAQKFFAQFPPDFAREVLGLTPVPRAFSPGDLVAGRFQIVGFLGAGGMGEVYDAEDLLLDRAHVALKTLPADVAGDAAAIARLTRELALARQVTHVNVCRVFDVDHHVTPSGASVAFFTMELLTGETLAERLQRRGLLSIAEAYPLVDGKEAHMKRFVVTISVDKGQTTCEPSTLHVGPGDTVRWTCEEGDLALDFKNDNPFTVSHVWKAVRDQMTPVAEVKSGFLSGRKFQPTISTNGTIVAKSLGDLVVS